MQMQEALTGAKEANGVAYRVSRAFVEFADVKVGEDGLLYNTDPSPVPYVATYEDILATDWDFIPF